MPECSVVVKPWSELTTAELYSILKLRTDVFFVEQKIDEEELDNRDFEPSAVHYWITDGAAVENAGQVIAYLRVLFNPAATHLAAHRVPGRVVVRADRRGEGLAQLLFEKVIDDFGAEPLLLHAQEYVAPLYAKFGFAAFGDTYLEAGIRHVSMCRP